jgi:sirohydrochlorin cobaltochelatase
MKKGVLIVSFGTTYKDTREKNIDRIEQAVRQEKPDCMVLQAYSSDRVRDIIKKRDGIDIPGIKDALERMAESGVTHLTVLPTHVIDGIENNKMKQIIKQYRPFFQTLKTADPLLGKEEDYGFVAKALWDSLEEEVKDGVLIFMGHGSYHEADNCYEKMEKALREYSGKEIYIATVEGSTSIEDVIERMNMGYDQQERQKIRVVIVPFMLVAGDHAVNDMAGEEDSFLLKVKTQGYEAECILKGLGEYESIRLIYLQHLEKEDNDK